MGQSSLPRSLGSRDLCEKLWVERELASESFLRSHLSSANCSSLVLGVKDKVPDAINLPCALSKVEGLAPLGPAAALASCILLCV